MVRLIAPAEYRSMPWKNGGGVTAEIAAHPPDAALDAFAWRVSIATVDRSGPFSRFPGVDRQIVLLDGAGMHLTGDHHDAQIRTPFVPYAFEGDDYIDCRLGGGAIRDFNAMFRRGKAMGAIDVVRTACEIAPHAMRLVYAARGMYACSLPGHTEVKLQPDHTLLVHDEPDDGSMSMRPLSVDAVALVVSIDRP
jgi:environmental stress-induced protein Ves